MTFCGTLTTPQCHGIPAYKFENSEAVWTPRIVTATETENMHTHDTSPTTASVLSLSRSSTPGSTTAISCLSGFLSTSNDAYRPYSMLQHVWCSDFVATTKSLTPSRYYTAGLRVPERVNFKLALMAYHVLNGIVL